MATAPANVEALTADQILLIDEKMPERLFPRGLEEVKRAFHALAKKWHPDLNHDPQAASVLGHLTKLRDKAEEKLETGTWQEAGYFSCRLKDGQTFRVRSDAMRDFDLGTMHIAPHNVTYVVKRDYADLFKNAVDCISKITFLDSDKRPDSKLRDVYAPCLPITHKIFEAEDALILTVKKRPDDVRLRDLLPHLPKDTRDKHVAWITSRMHEMARYLDHTGLTHNAINLDNVFASPSCHTIGLFGGWWYAAPVDTPLKAVPGEALDYLSDVDGKPIKADGRPDREMIRAAARELLGDRAGTRLAALKAAPQPMIDYLRTPSSGDAQRDLQDWHRTVLPNSFGARRFTELKVKYSDVYKPGGSS